MERFLTVTQQWMASTDPIAARVSGSRGHIISAPSSSLAPSPPLYSRPLKSRLSQTRLRGLGERCKFLQWGLRRSPSSQRLQDLETRLISKTCIFLCIWFVLPCPSLLQQSSHNLCIFLCPKEITAPPFGAPSADAWGDIPLTHRYCTDRQVSNI